MAVNNIYIVEFFLLPGFSPARHWHRKNPELEYELLEVFNLGRSHWKTCMLVEAFLCALMK
jgi:hypothetical protein